MGIYGLFILFEEDRELTELFLLMMMIGRR